MHEYVLRNDANMAPFLLEYDNWKESQGNQQEMTFLQWVLARVDGITTSYGREVVSKHVFSIIKGPSQSARSYNHMRGSGCHFQIFLMDRKRTLTTDSKILAWTHNDAGGDMLPFSDIIRRFLEVDFGSFQTILIGTSWYRCVPQGNDHTVEKDKCGFY